MPFCSASQNSASPDTELWLVPSKTRSVATFGGKAAISCCVFQSMPFDQVNVQMERSALEVAFRCLDDNSVWHFQRGQYEVNGVL